MSQSTALLVIDVQVGLFTEPNPVYHGAAVVARIQTLIDRARQAGLPVVFIQDNDVGPLDSPAWQVHPALESLPNDLFIRKPYGDAFYQTNLHTTLAARDIHHLVITGCKTDMCVDVTSRRAVSLGYDVTLIGDGHTTTDNQFLTAAQSIVYYNAVLDGFGLEDGFGSGEHSITIRATDEIQF